ncbi:galactokinase family protein [Actinomyces glycerinitolerans]|uniref:Galactokinase n=1 Tax=Actinomyces glycerinitolerans TaxID=1892869 RepID=A0A1M4S0N4_9ACTO|nr:galactokinase family protein [Actinomyces glycerinitolerans]SHE25690.1 galactokinase [Actinomyces glycerinitolerans]
MNEHGTPAYATNLGSSAPVRSAWRVPGRIEILGKHTDYAGGRVLVGAVERGVTVCAERSNNAMGTLTATTTAGGEPVSLTANVNSALPVGHWGHYLQTVLDRLTNNFCASVPASLTITSDLPPASGMSSSSALVCACALALADLNGWSSSEVWKRNIPDRLSLAGYFASVENGRDWRELPGTTGVGTQGGSEDHTGILCGARDKLLYAEFDPAQILRLITFPSQWSIVVGISGVLAEKSGAALADYNRGPETLQTVLARWNEASGRSDTTLASAVRSLIGEATGSEAMKDPQLKRLLNFTKSDYERGRVEQFLIESLVLVPAGADAIATADANAIGAIVNRSHSLANERLHNQVPATNSMVSLARDMGAIGASAFGAGWGGSVYAIVPSTDAYAFADEWIERYRTEYDALPSASAFVTRPGDSATQLEGN